MDHFYDSADNLATSGRRTAIVLVFLLWNSLYVTRRTRVVVIVTVQIPLFGTDIEMLPTVLINVCVMYFNQEGRARAVNGPIKVGYLSIDPQALFNRSSLKTWREHPTGCHHTFKVCLCGICPTQPRR